MTEKQYQEWLSDQLDENAIRSKSGKTNLRS